MLKVTTLKISVFYNRAGGGRTHTSSRTMVFKTTASAFPPPPQLSHNFNATCSKVNLGDKVRHNSFANPLRLSSLNTHAGHADNARKTTHSHPHNLGHRGHKK